MLRGRPRADYKGRRASQMGRATMPGKRGRTGIANIGYEKRTVHELIEALRADGVRKVVDVRADPVSRRAEFNAKRLELSLRDAGIEYVPLREMGIPREVRKGPEGKAGKGALLEWYARHLDANPGLVGRLVEMSKGPRIALLCYEREESECHRGVLSQRLRAAGVRVDAL